jgi:hypothetical protein
VNEAMKSLLLLALTLSLSLVALSGFAATPPYAEDFESYLVGNTAVANFTEVSTSAWTIVSPGILSTRAYQDDISAVAPGTGAAATNSSAGISFPSLSSSSFTMATSFRIDTFTLTGSDVKNTGAISLFARGATDTPASSSTDRYQVYYFLDDDGLGAGHTTGRLWLTELNLFNGDSLNELSASTLPVTPGNIYQFTLSGTASGGSLILSATLTDTTTSTSITVTDTDASNLLTGSNFGYFNGVYAEDGGSALLNADFDNFSMLPEPGACILLLLGFGLCCATRRLR